MNTNTLKILLFITIASMLGACSQSSSLNKSQASSAKQTNSAVLAVNLKAMQPLRKITSKLAQHRTVLIGESHTSYGDHLNQLTIIKGLHKHWGKKISIGLEMIQQPYQPFLDKYIAGKMSERQMLKGTEWYKRWKYEFRLYQPTFRYAQKNKIPLVALNIPAELTKRISKVGISNLSKEERMQLPAYIDRSNKAYTKRISKVFAGHSHTKSGNVRKFIDAQLGWDEGMAFAAAKYLDKHSNKNMVIIAGGGHVINYEGIPSRLDRLIKNKSAVVLSHIEGDTTTNSGDYLLISPEKKLPPTGRFGIGIETNKKKDSGVLVTSVSKKSAAFKAGIQKNDLIIQLDNQPIKDITDFKIFAETRQPDSKIMVKVKRQQKILSLPITLMRKVPSLSFFRHK